MCLVLLRHVIDELTPFELASVASPLVRTVLERRQPVEDAITHDVFPPRHEASVPGVFVRFGLHDNVRAAGRALNSVQDRPIIMALWLVLR